MNNSNEGSSTSQPYRDKISNSVVIVRDDRKGPSITRKEERYQQKKKKERDTAKVPAKFKEL